jgi:hypothetical protein
VWEEETEDGEEPWVQIRTNLGHATQSTEEGRETWHFTQQYQTCTFQLDEWEYHTRVDTLPDEVVVRRERRRMEDGKWVFQYETEEDSMEWTEDPSLVK